MAVFISNTNNRYQITNTGIITNVLTNRVMKQSIDKQGYYKCDLMMDDGKKKTHKVHRLVANAFIAGFQVNNLVDHIDGDKLNNNLSNLRIATKAQNAMNSKKKQDNTSSKFKGVYLQIKTNKWRASININNKSIHIGCYFSEEAAADAYNTMAKQMFGAFACINDFLPFFE